MGNTKTTTIKCPKCKQSCLGTWVVSSKERMCIWCGSEFLVKGGSDARPKSESEPED